MHESRFITESNNPPPSSVCRDLSQSATVSKPISRRAEVQWTALMLHSPSFKLSDGRNKPRQKHIYTPYYAGNPLGSSW